MRHTKGLTSLRVFGVFLWACGGTIVPLDAGDASTDGSVEAGKDASSDAPNVCVSPSGYRVCHGPNACPADDTCNCQDDFFNPNSPNPQLSICESTVANAFNGRGCNESCADGDVCAIVTVSSAHPEVRVYFCVSEELGRLYQANGGADRLRYADWSDWTNAPVPTSPTCPTVSGFGICGGACPTCGLGELCTGRSPLHPYSLCIPDNNAYCTKAKPGCPAGQSCFLFTVQADAQSFADAAGYCMPTAACKAAQGGYPGGATCLP